MSDRDVQIILIEIEATTAKLQQELKRGEDAVSNSTKNMDSNLAKVGGAFDRMSVTAGQAVRGAVSSLRGLVAPVTAEISALAALSKSIDVQREFDRLNTGLISTVGSSEKASVALEALRDFARKTPYDLGQAVEGFTKLVNLGLTPSEQAMLSYGNTASAMGKDLNQMIAAVADASVGEFGRLEEFGIKAAKEGDQVALTFQGVTTRIGNNASEIEQYLIALGENQFASAMALRMQTLDETISTLGETWDETFQLINEAGAGELMRGSVVLAIEALGELNAMLASGELEGYLGAMAGKFDGWGADVQVTLKTVGELFSSLFVEMGTQGESEIAALTDGFKNLPENVRAFIQLMTVEVLAGFDKASAYAVAFKDGVKAVFTGDTMEGVGARLEAELTRINGVRDGSIASIIQERDVAVGSYEQQMAAAEARRKKYEEERAAREKETSDRLAQFKVQAQAQSTATAATKESTDAFKEQQAAIDAVMAKALPEKKRLADLATDIETLYSAHSQSLMDVAELGNGIKTLNEAYAAPEVARRAEEEKKTAEAIKKVDDAVRGVMDRLDPAAAAARKYREEQDALKLAMEKHPERIDEYRAALEQLDAEYEENRRSATLWGQFTNKVVADVDQVFADAWKGTFENSEELWEKLKEGFKQTLAEMAHEAITKPIIISFANQVLGTNTKGGISDVWGSLFGGGETIGNGSGGSGSGFGNIIDIGKNIYSIYDTLTGVGSEIVAGFMKDGLTGAFKGGINYYSTMLQSVYSKVASMFGQAVGQSVTQSAVQAGAGVAVDVGVQAGVGAGVEAAATGAGTAAASGVGTGFLSGMMSSMMANITNPSTWAYIGALMSGKLYSAGVRLDADAMRDSTRGNAIGDIWTAYPAAANKLYATLDSIFEPLVGGRLAATITGSSLHQAIWTTLNGAIFGKKEQFKRTVGSAVGQFTDGEYTGLGTAANHYQGSAQFGDDVDSALHGLNETFSRVLGGLFEKFDIDDQILTDARVRLRRTSGKLASDFYATIGDQMLTFHGQYAKGGNIALGMEQFFNAVMGEVMSKAIGISQLPEYLKELTGGLKTAEDVNTAIGGLFQRFEGVNTTLETLKLKAFGLTDAGLRAADSLLELSTVMAGLENATVADKLAAFGSLTATYYDKFFTEAEKNDALIEATKKQFQALDLELPNSRDGFREMVNNADLTTEAGRQMFMTLMQLAGQTAAYFDLVEQTAAASLQAAQQQREATLAANQAEAEAAFGVVQRSISAEQRRLTAEYQAKVKEMDAQAQAYAQAAQASATARANSLQSSASMAGDRVQSLESLVGALDSALERLRDTSEETTKQLRAQAVATLEQALAGVRAGQSVLNFSGLEEALERASELDGETFASLEDFKREQGRTANMVAELRGVADKQLTNEERVLKSLEDQLSVARSSASSTGSYQSAARAALDREYELAMQALQTELDEAQRQMDALNGIDNSVMSVVDAVNAMSSSVTAALKFMGDKAPAATGDNTAQMVDRMYKAIAGFAPDAGGIHFWVDQLTTGKSTYAEFIKALEGARVPAFATGGLHTGGLRLVGENGPELEVTGPSRIYSASQTAAMLSSGATEEVRALRSDFAGMSDALRSIAKHTQQTARRVETLERWDGDGMPGERTA
ncbi:MULTISPECIES: hypothetical protein [unclassified Pseudomonas]|uniref:hypothetical protein n=1 Tax=unclassified Pseudomonas TaxID=196821 RepID=UPI00244A1316|nr:MULTISPECIES: hypothetical protein [unclassified Pseudomonas]MDH0896357.1 hypothetical protein [Pseudomonas sp. GD03875]MDH1066117.1 hypothetical protein [Pseudomonas sp. GD03985]